MSKVSITTVFKSGFALPWGRVALFVFPCFAAFVIAGQLGTGERSEPILRVEKLIARQNFARALSVLEELDDDALDAGDVRNTQLQRAICLMNTGEHADALAIFQALEDAGQVLGDYIAFWMGQCAEAMGQAAKAESHYAKILHMEPESLLRDQAALDAARGALAQGNAEGAVAYYQTLIGKGAREGDALAGLTAAWAALEDSVAAREAALRLIETHPTHPGVPAILAKLRDLREVEDLFYAGVAYMHAANYQQAADLLYRVVAKSDDVAWRGKAQCELGHVYYRRGKYLMAESAFERAYKVYNVPEALFHLGRCAIKRGRDLAAIVRFVEFARLFPDLPDADEALWQAGMAYERRGRHRDARALFLELAKSHPTSAYADRAAWRAGFALYQTRQYAAAGRAFLHAARQASENHLRDQGHYWAGKCYQALGQKAEAEVWMERATEGFPMSYYSARARAVLGKTDEVLFDASRPSAPPLAGQVYEPSAHVYKGDALAALGLYRNAEREYDRARRIHARDVFALEGLLLRYERVRAMHKAFRVSSQIAMLQRGLGVPMTLSSFRRLYPIYFWGEINRTARKIDLDPHLVIAIMRQESAFHAEAVSRAGARGLMQVMPETGQKMARRVKLKNFSSADLFEPNMSIWLGGVHLADHLKTFQQDERRQLGLALSAYNAGPEVAKRWAKRLTKRDFDEFVERIPYKETRNYVKLVYRNYRVYSYLNERVGTSSIGL